MYKIAAVTGTRADYGLLRPVLKKLSACPAAQTQIIATGAHLAAEYGGTLAEIEADGFLIAEKVDILSQPVAEGRKGTAQRTAIALEGFVSCFTKEKPDVVLALGDRYEMFAAATAASLLNIPIAHISGGDVTFGADDEWFRHCITKMAKLHFPSCEEYRQRVIRMGEAPETVFNVGGLGDENIRTMQLMPLNELAENLSLPLNTRPYALVTFHPETAGGMPAEKQVDILLSAISKNPQLFYLFTAANADAGGTAINKRLEAFCKENKNAALVASLGVLRYLSCMQNAALVLGNSSSGVVETPSFGVPAVDIGTRQMGRVTGENVLHTALNETEISDAILNAQSAEFARRAKKAKSPYNGGETSARITAILLEFLENNNFNGPKTFYDGSCDNE